MEKETKDVAAAAVPEIFRAIPAIMADMSAVGKNKQTQEGARRFAYRGIDDVMNAMWPLLSKHRVFVAPEVMEQHREERGTSKGGTLLYSILRVRFTFYASDGSSVQAVTIGEGMDSGDKSSNKAMAVALKYALFQTFCIPTEEMAGDDPDRQVHSVQGRPQTRQAAENGNRRQQGINNPAPPQNGQDVAHSRLKEADVMALHAKLQRKDINPRSMMDFYRVGRLEDMTMAQFKDAMAGLDAYPDVEAK